ncbi:MAG: hypothetical protein AAF531_01500 [Actinomycetota bacterium]
MLSSFRRRIIGRQSAARSARRVRSARVLPVRVLPVLVLSVLALAGCGGGDDDDAAVGEEATTTSTATSGDPDTAGGDTDSSGEGTDALEFSSELTVLVANTAGTLTTTGPQRVMTALIGDGPNSFFGGPDEPVSVRFEPVNGDTVGEVQGTWLTTNASALGLYVTSYEFDQPGIWEVTVFGDGVNLGATLIDVVVESPMPRIGDPAPRSETLTGATPEEIATISTDLEPDPSFYDLTIAQAVTNGTPSVIAFVTPAFCQTALCGPTLETVKAATAGRNDVDVLHVEPFDLALAPLGDLTPLPVMSEWGLVTEPWVFVVDGNGLVTASFEGIIGQAELEEAVAALG